VSFFGDKLHAMALVGFVGTADPHSAPAIVAAIALLYCVPFLVIMPAAGAIVDRFNRLHVLIACDACRAFLVALVPLAARVGTVPMLALVALVFVLSLIFDVAKLAIVPTLVPASAILEANAVLNMTARIATLFGIVSGGLIVGAGIWNRIGIPGYTAAFFIDAATFCVSVITLLRVTTRPGEHDRRPAERAAGIHAYGGAGGPLRQAFGAARRNPLVAVVLGSSALLGFVGGCMYAVIVLALQTRTTWGTRGVGFVVGIMACGIVTGAALVELRGRRWRRETIIGCGFVAIAGLLIGAARPFRFPLHGPLSFLAGVALGPSMIAQDTVLHEQVADKLRGRMFSLRDVIVNTAFGLSAALAAIGIAMMSRLGIADPFRIVMLAGAPVVLAMTAAGWLTLRGETAFFRPATWLLGVIPPSAVTFVSERVADACAVVLRSRRRAVLDNLARNAPDRSSEHRRLLRQTFRNLARCSLALLRVPLLDRQQVIDMIEFTGLDHLERAVVAGRGAILVFGHLGAWELAGVALAARGYPLHAVAEGGPGDQARFSEFARYRAGTGMRFREGGPTASTEMIPLGQSALRVRHVLRAGGILALAGDRALSRTGSLVRFGGGRRLLPYGPARLSRRFGVPILILSILIDPERPDVYRGRIEPLDLAGAADDSAATQLIADRISLTVRQHPDQWFALQAEWLD
jgi:KDO2-lipid IV(A) lauroyltransferase